jgi:hypothetical protein
MRHHEIESDIMGKRKIGLEDNVRGAGRYSSCGVFGLLGGLKHLHDSFDPLHTEATLWITDVQLREGALGTSDNWRMGADDALDPAVYRTLI